MILCDFHQNDLPVWARDRVADWPVECGSECEVCADENAVSVWLPMERTRWIKTPGEAPRANGTEIVGEWVSNVGEWQVRCADGSQLPDEWFESEFDAKEVLLTAAAAGSATFNYGGIIVRIF